MIPADIAICLVLAAFLLGFALALVAGLTFLIAGAVLQHRKQTYRSPVPAIPAALTEALQRLADFKKGRANGQEKEPDPSIPPFRRRKTEKERARL